MTTMKPDSLPSAELEKLTGQIHRYEKELKETSENLQTMERKLSSYKIELEQSRKYLQCILQNSADMIFATEVTGILVSLSAGGEKVLGYSWEQVAGRDIKEFVEDPVAFEAMMVSSQKEGYAMAPDIYLRNKDGNRVHCHASLMTLSNRDGQRVGTVGICRDITQWKKLQDDLIQVDRLAEIGRIAAGVAHEINNPLAVIKEASGWGRVVLKDAQGLSPDDRQELEKVTADIISQTKRCRNITHKLLDFARNSAPTKVGFDIHELLRETVVLLKPESKHGGVQIDFNFADKPLFVNSDPKLLEQVFVNFMTNAIHALLDKGAEKRRMEIETRRSDEHIEICFKDNGIGIPAADRMKIFELFYTTKPPGKGTGLGLTICQNIVQKLGGDVTCESEAGVGTTFTVRLPVS
jgi:two-component system NtrC family sensor kinase